MQPFSLVAIDEHLGRTPAILDALLANLDPIWLHANYGPDTFSPFDVLGHLILGEQTDSIPRAKIILVHGTSRPFDPFPHDGTGLDTENPPTITDQLALFESLRSTNRRTLREFQLTDDQLDLRGRHPDPSFAEVTLRQLLATWAVHDQHHLAQICKCVARQFENEVGPWRPYIGILATPIQTSS